MGALIKWLIRIVLAAVVIVALGGGGLYAYLLNRFHASTPEITGERAISGASGPVRIYRDMHGIPHIFADTDEDVFFGLGYAHAQDRLFQMELIRRSVQGRTAELIGAAALPVDQRAHIRGFPRAAAGAAAQMSPETRTVVEAYTRGVNALLNDPDFVAPPEYHLLFVSPEPWTLEDSAAVVIAMGDQLVTGLGDEVSRARLADTLSPEQIDEFLPSYPDFAPIALAAEDLARHGAALREGFGVRAPAVREGPAPGSNNWVVSGEHTVSGAPLLANDPHLGLSAPGVWYFARLALSEGDVVGATLPGAPFVTLGRNERAAWAFTNAGFDVTDFILIPLDELEAETRTETISVRFGGDVQLEIQETEHGPVLNRDRFPLPMYPEDHAVVIRTTLDDEDHDSFDAIMNLMRAHTWYDFIRAGRGYVAPVQSMLFANVDGDIGYFSPGRVPERDETGAWVDEIPFTRLPQVRNPASGRIVTANNRIVPDAYPYDVPGLYNPYRAYQIERRIVETDAHEEASFRDLQLDVASPLAERLLPALSRARPSQRFSQLLLEQLRDWDAEMDLERAEPLIFAMWFRYLHPAIYADELGEDFGQWDQPRALFIDQVLNGRASQWCDNVDTPERETCAEVTGAALDAAAADLIERFGADPTVWRWGDAHQAVFDHPVPPLQGMPFFGERFGVRVPMGGDGSSVNVAGFWFDGSFDVRHAASMRAIYDLSDLDASQYMHAPGQSAHPLSPHYADLAPLWAAGEYFQIRTDWTPGSPPPDMRLLTLTPSD